MEEKSKKDVRQALEKEIEMKMLIKEKEEDRLDAHFEVEDESDSDGSLVTSENYVDPDSELDEPLAR